MGANLRIGATVDVAELKAGMQATVEEVKSAAQKIPIAFDEAAGRTKAAFNKISEETKQAAQVVSIESAKVAQATKAYAAAMAELRNATVVAKDAKLDDAATTNLLAAAQQKAAAAAKELAEAKAAEARSVAASAEEEELSENVVIRAFQRAAAAVSEASAEIREQLVETAEVGGLEAEGLTAGFAGFSKLLGAGIAVGFAANYIDGLAKINVELEHLAAKTGISIEELSGLQQILKEAGGDFETVATGLVRMESNTQKLAEHDKNLELAFTNLGLNIQEVWRAKPDELLQMIAEGMSKTADANVRANSAIAIFGRGGQELIPILREQGSQLLENMRRTGQLTGITDQSAEAARRWTQDTARLSAQFRSVMIPVMEHAEDVIRGIAGTTEAVAAVILTVFETIATAVTAALQPLGKLGQELYYLVTGQFSKMVEAARSESADFASVWRAGFKDVEGYWAEVKRTFSGSSPLPPLPELGEGEPGELPGAKPKKTHENAFQRDEEQLNQLRLESAQRGYALGVDAEIDFWNKRLAAAKKGTEEYREIIAKLAQLEEEKLKLDRKNKSQTADYQSPTLDSSTVTSVITEMTQEVKEQQKQQVEAQREAIDEQIRMAADGYKVAEEYANEEVAMGRMTTQERIAYLRQAAAQELEIEQGLIRAKQILDNGDLAKQQQDANRSVQIARQQAQQIAQLMKQSAEETQRVWVQAWDRATSEFDAAVGKWVVTGKGFTQSLAQMWAGMVDNFTRNILKMVEQYLIGLALQKSGQKSQILADAKTAAANTYSSVSAIPVVGPFLAPVAAAGAFAGVMAFDTFSEGGVVRGGGGMAVPILAHAGERVLSPTQTQNFETLVNRTESSSTASNTINMGGITQNFHGAQASPRDAARGIQDAVRRGRVRFA